MNNIQYKNVFIEAKKNIYLYKIQAKTNKGQANILTN